MKLTLIAALAGSASAFAPAQQGRVTSAVFETSLEEAPVAEVTEANGAAASAAPLPVAINGWVADPSQPLMGLPGSSAPFGYFDPLGFGKSDDLSSVKRLREAEVMHGRVAMMATLGYLIGESTPTITYGMDVHHTIANNQIPEVPGTVMFPFFLAINIAEAWRASAGWVEPGMGPLFSLRENYYPGDIGFDPFGLKPKDPKDFANMATKELNNGRLAMFAVAGMCVQELVNGKGILENLGF